MYSDFACLLPQVLRNGHSLLGSERVTLYLYDRDKKELWTKVSVGVDGEKPLIITLPLVTEMPRACLSCSLSRTAEDTVALTVLPLPLTTSTYHNYVNCCPPQTYRRLRLQEMALPLATPVAMVVLLALSLPAPVVTVPVFTLPHTKHARSRILRLSCTGAKRSRVLRLSRWRDDQHRRGAQRPEARPLVGQKVRLRYARGDVPAGARRRGTAARLSPGKPFSRRLLLPSSDSLLPSSLSTFSTLHPPPLILHPPSSTLYHLSSTLSPPPRNLPSNRSLLLLPTPTPLRPPFPSSPLPFISPPS